MAGQEGSNNNKGKDSIPKYQYERPHALSKEKFPDHLFMPQVVSLGPVHYVEGKDLLVTKADKCKIKEVLDRKNAGDFGSLEMKDALKMARALYEPKELKAMIGFDDFDEMMILDACFIIHAIDYINEGKSEVLDERPHLLPLILEDMFLLENQVPIIVLKAAMKVLGREYPEDIDEFVEKIAQSPESVCTFFDTLMDLPWPFWFLVFLLLIPITPAILLVLLVVVLPLALLILLVCLPLGLDGAVMCLTRCIKPRGKGTVKQPDPERGESGEEKRVEQASGQETSHLLDLLRAHLLECSKENQPTDNNKNSWLPPRRATELTDAGIKFHRSTSSSVKDVTFEERFIYGHLNLPSLAQLTKTRLVNLMAYKLCPGVSGHGITSYVSFLDGLIDCPEDVKELRSTQILPNALGDDQQVAHFFNTMGNFLAPFAYPNVLNGIETHCHSRWRPSTAKFCKTHFSSPSTTVSFLIAILLFVITIATAYKSFFGR